MLNRLLVAAVAALAIAAPLAGCSASVDAQGNVLTDRVWFDQAGNAHCPHADCTPRGADGKIVPSLKCSDDPAEKKAIADSGWKPGDVEASLVLDHRNVCEKGHPVTWESDDVICWACQGARTCPTCKGTGRVGPKGDLDCPMCMAVEGDYSVMGGGFNVTSKVSTGICAECAGRGTIRFGGVDEKALRHEVPDGSHDF